MKEQYSVANRADGHRCVGLESQNCQSPQGDVKEEKG